MKAEFMQKKGTWREVADCANVTIHKEEGTAEPSTKWKRRMVMCEHSPIRELSFDFKWTDLKYWVSVHTRQAQDRHRALRPHSAVRPDGRRQERTEAGQSSRAQDLRKRAGADKYFAKAIVQQRVKRDEAGMAGDSRFPRADRARARKRLRSRLRLSRLVL